MSTPALRRVVRRETHSARTGAMIVAVLLVALGLIYVGVEIVLSQAGQPPLIASPLDEWAWLAGLPTAQPPAAVIAAGAALALIGLVFIILAIKPGRLSKHTMDLGGRAVVVDNGVIASSVAQAVADELGVSRDAVTVGVSHRTADVTVRPGVGIELDQSRVRQIADDEIARYHLHTTVRSRARIVRPAPKEAEA